MVLTKRPVRRSYAQDAYQATPTPEMPPGVYQNSPPGNRLVPVLVGLLVVASFFIGTFYTKVKLLEKGTVSGAQVTGSPNTQAAQAPPPQAPVDVDITGAQVLGNASAKVAVVEFTDYQCPFCGQLFTNTFPSIKKDYIDSGKVKYIVRDFPLTQIHPQAQKAAEASNCATDQGKFWEYHDTLFTNQQALTIDDLKKYATQVGLNTAQFNACLDSGKYADKVNKDLTEGAKYGVNGTPASFIGVVEGNTVKQAVEVSGAQPFDAFKIAIDEALKKA